MNNIKKFAILPLVILILTWNAAAQPRAGSVLLSVLGANSSSLQNATVLSVDGKRFTCRFSQTNSEYTFEVGQDEGTATVVSTKGGKSPAGTLFYYSEYFILDDTYGCLSGSGSGSDVIVKFADGKAFIGMLYGNRTAAGDMKIDFIHSGNVYVFDKDGVVVSKTGGVYNKGAVAKIFCASPAYTPPQLKPHLLEQKSSKQ